MQLFSAISVNSKNIFNEHGEDIAEDEQTQERHETNQLSQVNRDSDEEKRTYKPRIYHIPRFSK